MTPKEKAFQLIEEVRLIVQIPCMSYFDDINSCIVIYKKLALIAVNEIMPLVLSYEEALSPSQQSDEYIFWLQVKNEIEKL